MISASADPRSVSQGKKRGMSELIICVLSACVSLLLSLILSVYQELENAQTPPDYTHQRASLASIPEAQGTTGSPTHHSSSAMTAQTTTNSEPSTAVAEALASIVGGGTGMCASVCLSVFLCVCVCFCESVLFVYLCLCLSECLPSVVSVPVCMSVDRCLDLSVRLTACLERSDLHGCAG